MLKKLAAALLAAVLLTACAPEPNYERMHAQTVLVSTASGHGSGVIVGPKLILTARHVIEDEEEITVRVAIRGGSEIITAYPVWIGGPKLDMALLRISDNYGDDRGLRVPPARVSCAPLVPGQTLYASGFPLSDPLPPIIVGGAVVAGASFEDMTLVQLPLIPGMSGGPVYDAAGRLVGLNTAIIVMPLGMFSSSATGVSGITSVTELCNSKLAGV